MKPYSRRQILNGMGIAMLPLVPGLLQAQGTEIESMLPMSGDRDWSGNNPLRYPDPDIITLDDRFRPYILFNAPIQRLYTGTLWAEGPAWNGVGQYLVWSDIPNNVQKRWLADDGEVTTFRNPSGNSNGNTFDYQGRQLSAEHGGRRVVRYEPSGQVTVIADSFEGRKLNSPNDVWCIPMAVSGSLTRSMGSGKQVMRATPGNLKMLLWSIALMVIQGASLSRPMTWSCPTACVFHRTIKSCMWRTPVPRKPGCSMWTVHA